MRISAKLAPTFDYPELEQFWRSADELGFDAIWNYDHFYGLADNATPTPSHGAPELWGEVNTRLGQACAEVGRDPAEIRRSVQIFLYPLQPEQVASQLDQLPRFAELGCEHAVLSFYQSPSAELLQRCAAL
ncbi:hypothetical protein MHPYR_70130 [uncultured Mycobacterium sp.]|uniref:Uncharacterized protein n=1 Tax=uncultured Mycobacterium sp. TaxID=171292 RepID=A0A1Y5PPG6_9MYCO|nr:hypothetical protein MHPYR_70130 [uncultured Mycobacterium sp.]